MIIFEELKDNQIIDFCNRLKWQTQLSNPLLAFVYVMKGTSTKLSTMSQHATISKIGLLNPKENLSSLAKPSLPQSSEQNWQSETATVVQFHPEQRNVFNKVNRAILQSVSTENLDFVSCLQNLASTRLPFLDAPGKTGETFVDTAIQWILKSRCKQITAVVLSAVAAQLLDDGRTAHSAFKIPRSVHFDSTCYIDENSQHAEEFKATALIIWNGIIMTHCHNWKAVNCALRDILWSAMSFEEI